MRTPLHAIFGFTSLAKLNINNPEEAAGYLDRAETASHQLLDMIDKVLEVSSLPGSTNAQEAECDLQNTLKDVYDFLRPQAKEKNITFTLDCAGLHSTAVYADQEKLHQFVLYLANNAVTYTNPGGRVSITAEEVRSLPHNYAVYRIIVADNGIGISPEFVEKIYEPFSREKTPPSAASTALAWGLPSPRTSWT